MRTKARPFKRPVGTLAGAAAHAASHSSPPRGDAPHDVSLTEAPQLPSSPTRARSNAAVVTPPKPDEGARPKLKRGNACDNDNEDDDALFDQSASTPASRRIVGEGDDDYISHIGGQGATNKRRRVLFDGDDEDSAGDDYLQFSVHVGGRHPTLIRVPAAARKDPTPTSDAFELMRCRLPNAMTIAAESDALCTEDFALGTVESVKALLANCTQTWGSGQSPDTAALLASFRLGMLEVVLSMAPDQSHTNVSLRLLMAGMPTARAPPVRGWSPSCPLLEMLGGIFGGSVFDDVATSWTDPDQKEMDEANFITAKMVYSVLDNVRASEFAEGSQAATSPLNIPGLVPTLRPYQDAAVRWMLKREEGKSGQAENESDEWELCWFVIVEQPEGSGEVSETIQRSHILPLPEWRAGKHSPAERQIFCNPFVGWVAVSYEDAKASMLAEEECDLKGGILAESMGLGKTVEVLACVLANPSPLSLQAPYQPAHSQDEERTVDSNDVEAEGLGGDRIAKKKRGRVTKPPEFHDAACICGRTASFTGCLSWVACEECDGAMHGHCAGFQSEEDLLAETTEGFSGARTCSSGHCPTCVASMVTASSAIESRATLIVTPPAIESQWLKEISRHTNIPATGEPLKVAVYRGIKDLSRTSASTPHEDFALVHPHKLADADIVLVTFQTLMCELGHSDDNPLAGFGSERGSRLRSRAKRRYRVLPSPLMSVKWWRVCLDEAQRVEVPTAKSAIMARKLLTDRRWCVSGTPIGRGRLDDLYGLLLFLSFKPFDDQRWFTSSFVLSQGDALQRLSHLLKRIMWRSTKANRLVCEQMGIPEQIEKKVKLKFSSVERYFYNRQYEDTSASVTSLANSRFSFSTWKYDSLNRSLQKLRAACCHPQVGAGGLGSRVSRRQHGSTDKVMSMDLVVEKLIEDQRTKCEEAQRVATLHTNGLASLTKLKAEVENDATLLDKSFRVYEEALALGDKNASPTEVIGSVTLRGSIGFRSDQQTASAGDVSFDWQMQSPGTIDVASTDLVWGSVNFDSSRAISCVKIRACGSVPLSFQREYSGEWAVLRPKECTLQVSSAAVGGAFVDVSSFTLSDDTGASEWTTVTGFRSQKSKAWRIVIKSYHDVPESTASSRQCYCGLVIKLFEPEIAVDDLQRLHILHNATILLADLRQARGETNDAADAAKLKEMEVEAQALNGKYLGHALAVHRQGELQLQAAVAAREKLDEELSALSRGSNRPWYEDVLAWCVLNADPQSQRRLCDAVHQTLSTYYENQIDAQAFRRQGQGGAIQMMIRRGRFRAYNSVDGLFAALSMRIQQGRDEVGLRDEVCQKKCVQSVMDLSSEPSDGELYSNSHCRRCRRDWEMRGPVCDHCHLEDRLVRCQRLSNDPEIHCVLKAIASFVSEQLSKVSSRHKEYLKALHQRSSKFFEQEDKVREEIDAAKRLWTAHFDLLSDIDELNQCKRTMRLQLEDEDVSALTKNEAAFVVHPTNIAAQTMEHEYQQATSLALLRRNQNSLRYLKNQRRERMAAKSNCQADAEQSSTAASAPEPCSVCLLTLDGDRSVLPCGHFFHPECVERLFRRSGGSGAIRCPLRCPATVRLKDVFLATDKSKEDGSRVSREVKGDWGTKVNRLVGDVVDAQRLGDRGVVFSQWDEMLGIVGQALAINGVRYISPRSGKKFGEDIKRFRESSDVPVLLLNVKNSAEGLTLTEANHLFMVEPILNCGLDLQAVNRIHRIGQKRTAYVHRYIVADTIEEKLDAIRMERQENHFEDDLQEQQKHSIKGGGIDGGFDLSELHQLFGSA